MYILIKNNKIVRTSRINYNDGCIEVNDNEEAFLAPDEYVYSGNTLIKHLIGAYIIIPTDMISDLIDMISFVEDILTNDNFSVVLERKEITNRSGKVKTVTTKSINMTPCSLIAWEDGDDELLQNIIDTWNNNNNSKKQITFSCKFDSLQDLNNFIELQL